MAMSNGLERRSRKCPYHAKVMKTFEIEEQRDGLELNHGSSGVLPLSLSRDQPKHFVAQHRIRGQRLPLRRSVRCPAIAEIAAGLAQNGEQWGRNPRCS